ncbi:MAG: flagellar filament capping protein FliD [Eubacterium sp.]|nr:flagellar filament capping protein FliD [Eubacterium sp.]
MAIRLSGLASGLDTEALVGALMSAQSLKKTKVDNAKTKLEWKQTKWTDLNSKLYKLYTEQASKLKLQSTYNAKKASVSDASKISVTASNSATNGSYVMEVSQIATSEYLTGSALKNVNSTSTKLADIDPSLVDKRITVTTGVGDSAKSTDIEITANTTISDFVNSLKNAGINANFDTTQKRFFLSSKESGMSNSFTITSSGITSEELTKRNAVLEGIGYDSMNSSDKKKVDSYIKTLQSSGVGTDAYNTALDGLAKVSYDSKNAAAGDAATKYVKAKLYTDNYDRIKSEAEDSLRGKYYDKDGNPSGQNADRYGYRYDAMSEAARAETGQTKEEYIAAHVKEDFDKAVKEKADSDIVAFVNKEVSTNSEVKTDIEALTYSGMSESEIRAGLSEDALDKFYKTGGEVSVSGFSGMEGITEDSIKSSITSAVSDYASIEERSYSLGGSALTGLGLADITTDAEGKAVINGGAGGPKGMAFIGASDSIIKLNGAELTSESTTVSVNGLSIMLNNTTAPGETVKFTVGNDVSAVYDTIKTALNQYNEIISEMNKLYTASSAKGYEPLSKEEKEAMSEDEIKLYEDKIKDSLFRGDSTLNGIIMAMKGAMQSTFEVDGQKYSLSSFGISTSNDWTEGGKYHIYGDKDDATFGDRQDKLRTALENDPETTMRALAGIFGNLSNAMNSKMASSSVSSALTFYNDIKIKDELKSYTKEISDWETRLEEIEEKYYKQFSKMESAMAKLQAQQTNLSSLFGN